MWNNVKNDKCGVVEEVIRIHEKKTSNLESCS